MKALFAQVELGFLIKNDSEKCWKCEGKSSAECQSDRAKISQCPSDDYSCEIEVRDNGIDHMGQPKLTIKSQCKNSNVCKNALVDNKNQCRPGHQG